MESLSYLHLEAASVEPLPEAQESVGASWDSEAWEEIFEEEEDVKTTD